MKVDLQHLIRLSFILHSTAKGYALFPRFKGTNSKKEQICFHVKRDTILKLSLKYSSSYYCDVQSIVFKRFNDDLVSFTLISCFEVSKFANF